MKCAPEWPPRAPLHKDRLKLALQILRERYRKHESAAAILKTYSRPQEGLKLSTLKLFLKADHKGPVRGGHQCRAPCVGQALPAGDPPRSVGSATAWSVD